MKLWKIVTKRQAEEDAAEIWRVIAEDNHRAAEAFLDVIEEAASLLASTLRSGARVIFPILNFRDCASCPCVSLKTTSYSTAR